ncbi:hypothetical protein [Streptomyces syringium]|uniref:hypothetical protein n=1 Tax=Streptomyces syringium TaxID=76729 RepID=UPI0037D23B72
MVERVTGTAGLAVPTASSGGSLVADVAGARVELPASGAGKLSVTDSTGTRLGIGLPGSRSASAHASAGGTVVYAQPSTPVDVAAQVTHDGSASALITLKDATAPTEYRFPLDLPSTTIPVIADDGGVVFSDAEGNLIGAFQAPWAKDADGKPVRTSYRFEGGELVQTIEVHASTAYPVVADPKWWDKTKSGAKKAGKAVWEGTKKYGVKCAKGAWHGAKNPGAMTPQQKAAFAAAGCVFFSVGKK